jgi:hypothetical protein
VANSGVTWTGLAEFQAALAALPEALVGDARAIVEKRAEAAESAIKAAYPASQRTLADRVTLTETSAAGDRFGINFLVKNTDRRASWFEWGTMTRYTGKHWNRGAMKPGRVFVPGAIRARAGMGTELIALVQAAGFTVTGA